MARRIPLEKDNQNLIYLLLSLSLLLLSIIITAGLCGIKSQKYKAKIHRKVASSTKEDQEKAQPEPMQTATIVALESTPTTTMTATTSEITKENEAQRVDTIEQPQPSSLTRKLGQFSSQKFSTLSSASKRKLASTISLRFSGNLSMKYRDGKDGEKRQKQKYFKPEDSIWMKTIMLGEKCRIPTEEDAIIYDEKGKRLSSYPSRGPRSLPVSRSNSFTNLPSFNEDKPSIQMQTSIVNQYNQPMFCKGNQIL
ncbi:hypothetical protein Sjap_019787 [Stephania japonica]|uniref:Uncharacterized protein n=1 Tax=Stephania japonica TaxID=461633 RepID=A0AAP0F6S8_9MAGN